MSELEPGSYQPHPRDLQAALRDLRARAERRQLVTHSLPADAPPDVQRLVQDLQVHQIELELQYEELLLAQTEAEASRAQYVDLYEFAPVGYCTVAADGTLSQLNLRTSQLLGLSRQQLMGRRLALFVAPTQRDAFADFLDRLRQLQQRQTLVLEMRRDDGQSFYARLEGTVCTRPNAPTECRLALTDVTEQYQARRELELSERRFRLLFEHSQDGLLLLRDNHYVDCNTGALRLLGFTSKQQVVGQHAAAFSPELQPGGKSSVMLAQQYWDEAMRVGYCRFEWCSYRATGEEFWEDILLTVIPESDGPLVHAAWRDITRDKEASKRIQESEERLQMALTASEMGVWTLEYGTELVHWDQRCQHIFGHPFDANPAPLAVLEATIHPEDRATVSAALRRAASEAAPLDLEHRIVWPDGSVRHVAAFGQVVGDALPAGRRFVGLMRDITARWEAKEDLRYKNRLLEHILQHLPVILARLNSRGEYLELVGAGLRRLGVQDNELVGQRASDLFPTLREPVSHLLSNQPITFVDKQEYQGEPVYLQKYGFFDPQRQEGVIFAIDITKSERRRVELQAEKEFTKSLLNSTIDAVVAFDMRLRVTAWNTTVAHIMDRSEEDALGQPFAKVLPYLAQDPKAREALRITLRGQPAAYTNWPGRHKPMIMDLNFVPLFTRGEQSGVLVIARDVTERHNLQAEATRLKLRRQQEVLSAILTTQEEERRRIAEGLHNGVGQLLYATRLHLDNLPPSELTHTSKTLLKEAIKATREISFELTPSILEDFGLQSALQELVKRIPSHAIRVDLYVAGLDRPLPRPVETVVYRSVQELLNNIMKHAQAQEVVVQVVRLDGTMHVSVEDNGVGFDTNAEDLVHGIGLAGIRTRTGLLGGTFELSSRPQVGTSVTLTLPLRD